MTLTDQTILITGGAGFLGRHVVEEFRRSRCGALVVPRRADYDLTCPHAISALLMRYRPQVVVHLAAQVGGIGANRRHPATFFYHNLMMGVQLIEASRRFGVEKFVAVGTICSYPKFLSVPFREEDLWAGYPEETNAPYGLAKKMLIVQLQSYYQEFGFRGVNLLLTNLYGPGDNFDPETSHVIPALIRNCLHAREQGQDVVTVWGTGKATREFLYVADAARAIRLALERLDTPEPVNIGTGVETPIADLVRLIADQVGFRGEIRFDASKPDGQPRRCIDVTKARELLGFEATTPLLDGLGHTIDWYRATQDQGQRRAA
jgi:GDP-L-fucose synthase